MTLFGVEVSLLASVSSFCCVLAILMCRSTSSRRGSATATREMNPFFLAMTALQNSAILAAPDFAKKILLRFSVLLSPDSSLIFFHVLYFKYSRLPFQTQNQPDPVQGFLGSPKFHGPYHALRDTSPSMPP